MAILGIDEVGRGPLAGPLVVGAVILPEGKLEWISELKDSKRLSAKKREKLSAIILAEAPATGLGWVSAAELDEIGISAALRLATRRAIEKIQAQHVPFSQIIIDGKINFLTGTSLEEFVSTVVKADDLVKEVSAASIIAKVARDTYMKELAIKFPEYGFEKNAGYGTAAHLLALKEQGACTEHRRSFEPIRSMVGFSHDETPDKYAGKSVVKNTTLLGRHGEAAVCGYLKRLGHKIIARNYRTKIYEIDIVSTFNDKIYFTEVKMRTSRDFGGGFATINKRKLQKMRMGAEDFLRRQSVYNKYEPQLAAAVGDGDKVLDWVPLGVLV